MDSPAILDLTYTPPYDWTSMLDFLAARAIPGVERVSATSYTRTVSLEGACGIFLLEPQSPHAARLTVHLTDARVLPEVVRRVRRLFDLDTDPRPIDAHFAQDPVLGPRVGACPGLRVPGAWDGFELAVRAVLGQQITVAAATALAGKLVQAYGEPLPVLPGASPKGRLAHLFPTPTRLESARIAELGMPRSRAVTLSSLAAAVLDDPAILGPHRNLEEAVARLRSMSGVGDWTAQYIAMRALREPDAFPASDIALLRALTPAGSERLAPAQLLSRAEAWRPWCAYAAVHLWTTPARPGRSVASAPSLKRSAA
jgi:AraC family transcriptional regulator of adaptative response / DNA-3-methyladenine glycosylase II